MAPAAMAGPLNAGGSVDLLTEANVRIGNLAAAAKVGDKIVSAGDFNGDGYKDVALGMWMLGADGPTRAQRGRSAGAGKRTPSSRIQHSEIPLLGRSTGRRPVPATIMARSSTTRRRN